MSAALRWAGAALLATLALVATGRPSAAAETVRYNMAWLPQGSQAGVFVALERGYYRAVGLDVEVSRGYGGLRTVNEVDQGLFDVGYGDPLAVLMNRKHGGATRMVAAINHRSPGGLCFLADRRQLRKPADLAGLRVGGGVGSPVQELLPVWLEDNGVDPSRVRLVQMDPAVVDTALLQGRIDAAECWLGSNKAVIEHLAVAAGRKVGWLAYRDFGVDVYGSGFVVSDDTLRRRPKVVRDFVAATMRGYALAREQPALAVRAMLKRYPSLEREVVERQVRDIAAAMPADGDPAALAHFDPARVEATLRYYARVFALEPPPAAQLFTNVLER